MSTSLYLQASKTVEAEVLVDDTLPQIITELYPDQEECVSKIYDLIENDIQRILLIAICGAGKTVDAGWIIREMTQRRENPTRCLFLVPLTTLVSQAKKEFESLNLTPTILQGDRKFDKTADVIIASLDTVGSRLKKNSIEEIFGEGIGIIFVDEAHYSSYKKATIALHDYYLEKGAVIIGLTGTPWRTRKKEYLGEWFDETVEAIQAPQLIKTGRIVPSRIFGFNKTFDLSKLDIGLDGDYRADQIAAQGIEGEALKCVVDNYIRLASDRIAIAFCANIKHAEALAAAFNQVGISSDTIFGTTKDKERLEKFKAVKEGRLRVLISVGCLHTGLNLRNISAILFVRPTRSKSLWHQSTGRGARTYEGKRNYLILDFGCNAQRLGSPTDKQDYDISDQSDKTSKPQKLKHCPKCFELVPVFFKVCYCGFEFGEKEKKEKRGFNKPLVELLFGISKEQAAFLKKQKRSSYRKRESPQVAIDKFIEEYGFVAHDDWHLHAVLGKNPTARQKRDFLQYLEFFATTQYHEYWLKGQSILEFGEYEANIFNWEKKNWWDIFNVNKYETEAEIKTRYRELIMIYHPDRSDEPNALEIMKVINNAWDEYKSWRDSGTTD